MIDEGFKLALIQLAVSSNKADNLQRAAQKVKEAADQGAHLVALPECFNSPYGTGMNFCKIAGTIKNSQSIQKLTGYFAEYAEEIETGESSKALSQAAKDNQVYLIGGSFPERKDGKLYNTSTTWGPNGSLLAVYRKVKHKVPTSFSLPDGWHVPYSLLKVQFCTHFVPITSILVVVLISMV